MRHFILKKLFKGGRQGITMIELLTVIAVLLIIIIISVANFNSSNKISELRNATDQLADNLRDLQSKTLANIKEYENQTVEEYELGYKLKFNMNDNQIAYDEIVSPTENLTDLNARYESLPVKSLNPNHIFSKIEIIENGNPIEKSYYNIMYLFPEAQIYLIENESLPLNQSELNAQSTRSELKLYIKRNGMTNWQGIVTIDRVSGKITSIIESI